MSAIVYWIEEKQTLFNNRLHQAGTKKFKCDQLALAFAKQLKDKPTVVSIDIKFK